MSADAPSAPALADINRLFVTALLALAQTGKGEEACQLAAKGWLVLRDQDAREAERLTAALHTLTRHSSRASLTEKGVGDG